MMMMTIEMLVGQPSDKSSAGGLIMAPSPARISVGFGRERFILKIAQEPKGGIVIACIDAVLT
jgi:hypothetical protein